MFGYFRQRATAVAHYLVGSGVIGFYLVLVSIQSAAQKP